MVWFGPRYAVFRVRLITRMMARSTGLSGRSVRRCATCYVVAESYMQPEAVKVKRTRRRLGTRR